MMNLTRRHTAAVGKGTIGSDETEAGREERNVVELGMEAADGVVVVVVVVLLLLLVVGLLCLTVGRFLHDIRFGRFDPTTIFVSDLFRSSSTSYERDRNRRGHFSMGTVERTKCTRICALPFSSPRSLDP